jgi:hypothetical protein
MTIAKQLKIKEFPFTIKDSKGNEIYYETSNGFWTKREYDSNRNEIYVEDSTGYWKKYERGANGYKVYFEDSTGYWAKWERDANDDVIYYENSDGNWAKREWDSHGNEIYYEDSNGFWLKREWDSNGNEIYYENSNGHIRDNRPKPEPCANYIEDTAICDSYGEPKGQCANCGGKDHEHPDHFAETSKKIDDACEIAYQKHLEKNDGTCWSRYRQGWLDALAWKAMAEEGGSDD